MSARRVARELAVIMMPQLPKDRQKLSNLDFDALIAKSVLMLVDYARQCLMDANADLVKGTQELTNLEIEHPSNSRSSELKPVPLDSAQLKEQVARIQRAIEFVAEALDVPEMALHAGKDTVTVQCRNCDHATNVYVDRTDKSAVRDFIILLVGSYLEHKGEVDELIKKAKAKWQIDRMFSIDRDILRLACTEAFFMPETPVNVCISEAVELCHRFADEKAAKFINGVLGDLSDEAKYFRLNGKFKESAEVTGSTGGAITLS